VANHHGFIRLRENSVSIAGPCRTVSRRNVCLIDKSKIDLESLLRAAESYKDPPELSLAMLHAGRIDFSSGFIARFARQFAALRMAREWLNNSQKA
jgi:hypothetical protein